MGAAVIACLEATRLVDLDGWLLPSAVVGDRPALRLVVTRIGGENGTGTSKFEVETTSKNGIYLHYCIIYRLYCTQHHCVYLAPKT